MPFTKDGIIPDIIMNPNAIPKRMTIAQLIECVFGKVGCISGTELDATPFKKVNVENITEIMEKLGYHGAGTEVLYNGKTGEQISAAIFMGPTFYYRLKHLVEDKQHCIDYETEILTNDGWKRHNELNMEHEIATLKDNTLVYEKPLEIFNYPNHQGDMYYIRNEHIDLAVTGEHRMWVSEDGINYGFRHAKDITDKVYYKKDALFETSDESKKYIEQIFGNSDIYETMIKSFADSVQQEVIHAGWTCNVYHDEEAELYICKLNKYDLNVGVKEFNNIVKNEVKPVWCVHVPSEVFLIRRNGKVCWTGNSRATGPYQLLTMQPAEGRSRDGGFRFGEMERDCFVGDTPVTLSNGLSIKIEDLENNKCEILGWDEKQNGIVKAKQTNFMCKGERECLEITYQDGRKIKCTSEHPILTSDNTWVKAKDLIIDETRVKAGITYPILNIDQEMTDCNGWSLKLKTLELKTDTREEYLKTLAFARILGYLVTDGTISYSKNDERFISRVYLGHMLDVEGFLDDLKLFCVIKQKEFKSKNLYSIGLQKDLLDNIIEIPGIITGKRIDKDGDLPHFILDENCPKPIIREFLGGLFGGDGHTCYISGNTCTPICFSQSKVDTALDSLKDMMDNIRTLLNRVGINDISIQKLKETSSSKKNNGINKKYQSTLHINMSDLISFSEKVGFRYCCHKSQRLEAAVTYKRFRDETTRQKYWIIDRVNEINNSENKVSNPLEMAIDELKQNERIIHDCAIPSYYCVKEYNNNDNKKKKQYFKSKRFPSATEFFDEIGLTDCFRNSSKMTYGVNRSQISLPTMNLKVINIKPIGLNKVYDIEVNEIHSFLANGIVSHNCMLSHGSVQFLKERTFDCSDKYFVWIDNETGMISPVNPEKGIYKSLYSDNKTRFSKLQIPYSSKLLIQELQAMHINPRLMVKK